MPGHPIDRIGLFLLLATAVTFAFGEAGLVARTAWPVYVMLSLAFLKGLWIALDFMELRHAPPLWRRLVVGWLAVVVLLILLAWALTSRPAAAAGLPDKPGPAATVAPLS